MALPVLPLIFVLSLALGACFVVFGVGFTAAFRRLLQAGDGRDLAAALLIPAIAAPVIIPISQLSPDYSRFTAPLGLSLLLGAMVFGVGMQIANACGSGSLVAAGQGARRMWITLPLFCLGGVLGSLLLPTALTWPSLPALDLPAQFGPQAGLALTEAALAATALILLRGARPTGHACLAATAIGLLSAGWFVVAGEPWGITMGLTVIGAQAVQAVGADLSQFSFWSGGGAAALLRAPVTSMPSALGDAGLLCGALLATAWRRQLRFGQPISRRDAGTAALGGLLMGIGARLSFGCNIGAMVSGMASGSLHGFVWLAAVLPGCWLGLRLRAYRLTSPQP